MTEAEKKLEGAESREDAAKKDSEEMPVWAADMMKKMDAMSGRMDAFEKGRADEKEREDAARKDESEKEEAHKAAEELEARKKEEEGRKDAAEKEEKEREDAARKDAEDRARADSAALRENRELKGQIAALDAQVKGLYREPSFEDSNALAEARSRADAAYQAVTGRPASNPLPGESPIAYRKRMADGLRKFSAKFKEERVDSLSGAAFDIVEQQIYADAAVAAKQPENLPAGRLRAVTRNDSGHVVTEYTGDTKAAWRNFSKGAVLGIRLKEPART